MCSRRTGRSTITASRIPRCGASSSLSSSRRPLSARALLEFRDDLRSFREAPRVEGLRANVSEFSELEEYLHHDIVVRGLRHADEVVFTHRVEDLHLRSELARQGHRGVRPLRRFLDTLDPLVRPIQQANVVWHDKILLGRSIITWVLNAHLSTFRSQTPV